MIAIDGPGGAGKSTVARLLAGRLGFLYLDTGALYRALTWKAQREGVDLHDEEALAEMAGKTALDLRNGPSGLEVLVDGRDVTAEIRRPEVTENTFYIARSPKIRAVLLPVQREFALRDNLVAEGRDTGTVVFPGARLKVYLDASLDTRARRRQRDLSRAGENQALERVREDLAARDRHDLTRSAAPLRKAPDAVTLDTGCLSVAEEVERIADLFRARSAQRGSAP